VLSQRPRYAASCSLSTHTSKWKPKGEAALTVISPYYVYLLLLSFPLFPPPVSLPSANATSHPIMDASNDYAHNSSHVGLCASASRKEVMATDALLRASILLQRSVPSNIYLLLH